MTECSVKDDKDGVDGSFACFGVSTGTGSQGSQKWKQHCSRQIKPL